MKRQSHRIRMIALAGCALALLASPDVGHAGFGDSLKKKLADKANKKAEEATDKAAGKTDKAATPGESADAEKGEGSASTGGAGGKVSTVSTRFDYVPGDSVLFMDEFKQDELGEFPARWRLMAGTFEVAEMEGERWLRCTSTDGTIRMKLPAMTALPEFWTLEFDFYGAEPLSSALTVRALGNKDGTLWEAVYPHGESFVFRSGDIFSSTPREGAGTVGGRHHVMFMARGTAIKAYFDRQRVASVPEISNADGVPRMIEFRLWASSHPMITNVRFAEGCRPAKDMLDEGKLVTYGIRFQTGSDVVLPESAPVLRQVATYMEAHPDVKLEIIGHTDNVGTAATNLDLSKRRAASVAKVLAEQFAITSDRFQTDGKGDTKALASNTKPEGRAMNRRVEFAKM